MFSGYFVVVDRQQQIDNFLSYVINLIHKIREHIDYMYHWMLRLAMSGVYEFYIQHQMLTVLNSLPAEWYPVRQSLEYRLNPYISIISLMKWCLRGSVSIPKRVYNPLEKAQVIWMLLLNSFHGLSRLNLEKKTLMK